MLYKVLFGISVASVLLIAAPVRAQAPVDEPVGSGASANWSGYVAVGNTYTAVNGTWTIPTPTAASQLSADATWVGIGGVSSSNLIQAGTQAIVQNGTIEYQAWYELLPAGQQMIPLTVRGGDTVTVSLDEIASNLWQISFTDNSTGQNYQTEISYVSTNAWRNG